MAHPETDWQCALARLDQGLALPLAERGAWLAALGLEHPGAARLLSKLLEAHGRVDGENLLQGLPQLLPMPQAVEQDPGRPGLQVGPFELVELLGRGGMGSVWRARYADGRLRREVAVKLPSRSHDPAAMSLLRERLVRERNFLARLEHPHIARVYDAGLSDDGQPFLAMEYVAGQPIDQYADAERLTVQQRIRLFLQVLEAVAFAHQQLVLHRDLKPGNVLVTEQGQVRLLDFGIARVLPQRASSRTDESRLEGPWVDDPALVNGLLPAAATRAALSGATESGLTGQAVRVYTLAYAAPEQVTGEAVSTSADVYSLGVMLHELLTGLSPYEPRDASRAALVEAVCHVAPLPARRRQFSAEAAACRRSRPAALRRALGGDLGAVIAKALAKRPAQRYATADALANELRRVLERQPVEARSDHWLYRLECFIARHPIGVGMSTAGVLLLAVSTGVAVHQADVSRRMETVAQREAAQALASQRFFSRLLSSVDPVLGQGASPGYQRGLDGALDAAEAEFSQMPEALALVLKQLGEIYIRLDVPDRNLQVQRKRVALLASLPGSAVDERVDAQIELARALPLSGDPEDRGKDLTAAHLALNMAHQLKASTRQQVNALCLLVDRYMAHGEAERSVAFAEQAVIVADAAVPALMAERSLAYAELGYSAARVGRFVVARDALQRSLQLDRAGEGRDQLEQVHTRSALAEVEYEAGHYAASRREAIAALDDAAKTLGPMEGTLLPLRMSVVMATLAMGEMQEAYTLAQRLLLDDMRSADTFRAGRASYAFGVASMAMHRFDEAWSMFSAAQVGLSVSQIWTLRLRTQQAHWLLLNDRPGQAEALLAETLASVQDERQVERDTFARAFERAGVASARLGRIEEARNLFAQACRGRRRWLEPSHPDRVRCESYLLMVNREAQGSDAHSRLSDQLRMLQQRELGSSALAASMRVALTWARAHQPMAEHLRSFPVLF